MILSALCHVLAQHIARNFVLGLSKGVSYWEWALL